MVKKDLKFLCWYCRGEFISTIFNADKAREFKLICPFCDAVCVGELPDYEKIKDLDPNKMEPILTFEPIKFEESK